jgi:hypothetical protein
MTINDNCILFLYPIQITLSFLIFFVHLYSFMSLSMHYSIVISSNVNNYNNRTA